MANDHVPPFVQALLDQNQYPHEAPAIQLVQTHISYVLIAGEHVYKFKKPVDFGFLDFSTMKKRKACCEQELLLNKRLCPDIYLDLAWIAQQGETFVLNGQDGDIIEYGVHMARMPEERMMSNLIKSGQLDRSHIESLVAVLADFYHKAENSQHIDTFGTAEAVGVNVLENFAQTEGFVDKGALSREQFDLIKNAAQKMLAREEVFAQRIAHGKIRDCHGDMYSANICLADKVYIYDCIEFNQRFRYSDVASDVAFLAMDLDFYGLDELSDLFIELFVKATDDPGLTDLLAFYKGYRAYVRGKIGLFTASDPAVDPQVQQECLENAAKYFSLATRYARQ